MFTIEELKAFVESKGSQLDALDRDKAYVLTMNLENTHAALPSEASEFAQQVRESLEEAGIKNLIIVLNFADRSQLKFTEREPE